MNGTKPHPLSEHAIAVLKALDCEPVPKHLINPGVRDRLRREDLAVQDGKMIVITDAGRAAVAQHRGGRRRLQT